MNVNKKWPFTSYAVIFGTALWVFLSTDSSARTRVLHSLEFAKQTVDTVLSVMQFVKEMKTWRGQSSREADEQCNKGCTDEIVVCPIVEQLEDIARDVHRSKPVIRPIAPLRRDPETGELNPKFISQAVRFRREMRTYKDNMWYDILRECTERCLDEMKPCAIARRLEELRESIRK